MPRARTKSLMLLVAATVLSGCGSGTDYADAPRPPQLVTITAAINDGRVLLSPDALGAGPVQLVVANETAASQQLTVSGPASDPIEAQSGPINPGDTATLQIELQTGSYTARTDGSAIAPAQLTVGPSRPSAQNDVEQP